MIRIELSEELRITLGEFLKKNYDVFAWSQGDMQGSDPQVTVKVIEAEWLSLSKKKIQT